MGGVVDPDAPAHRPSMTGETVVMSEAEMTEMQQWDTNDVAQWLISQNLAEVL